MQPGVISDEGSRTGKGDPSFKEQGRRSTAHAACRLTGAHPSTKHGRLRGLCQHCRQRPCTKAQSGRGQIRISCAAGRHGNHRHMVVPARRSCGLRGTVSSPVGGNASFSAHQTQMRVRGGRAERGMGLAPGPAGEASRDAGHGQTAPSRPRFRHRSPPDVPGCTVCAPADIHPAVGSMGEAARRRAFPPSSQPGRPRAAGRGPLCLRATRPSVGRSCKTSRIPRAGSR